MIRGAAAIDFYKQAFGAKEVMRMPGRDGKVGHAELMFSDAKVVLADESEDMDFLGPQARGGSPCVDATVKRAESLGAKLVRPIEDKFYGDRTGALEEPFGHLWQVATHKEDVPKK